MATPEISERRSCFRGAATSVIARNQGRDVLDLTLEAALGAIEDAGLERSDIDGLCSYPGGEPPLGTVQDALRLQLDWYDGGGEGPAQMRPIFNAVNAIAAGRARHVLCWRTVTMRNRGEMGWRGRPVRGSAQWTLPFHTYSGLNLFVQFGARFMHERGMTREDLGWIPLNARRNAALNPSAIYRDPLTMEDYLNAEIISTPLSILDCDVPCDGAVAFVLSAAETAADAPGPCVRFEALSARNEVRSPFDQVTTEAMWAAGARLWERTSFAPRDVDVAGLYDGFSTFTLGWLEALGFCPKGEVRDFIAGGRNISLDGQLPLNTGGGQLSGGRLHGFGHVHEVVTQLRGRAGDRQVPGAELGAVGIGGGPLGVCMLLSRMS